MSRKLYPSDLTAAQWEELAPLLPPDTKRGPPRTTDLREVVNGILYVLRGGIPWRLMPHDLPPWGTVWWYFRNWRDDGTWERVESTLRARVREAAGRDATPSAGHHRQPVGEDHGKKGAAWLRRWQTGNRTQAAHRGGHHGIAAGRGGSRRQYSGPGRRQVGARQTLGPVSPSTGNLGGCLATRADWCRGPGTTADGS